NAGNLRKTASTSSPCAAPKCQASSKNALRSGFRSAVTTIRCSPAVTPRARGLRNVREVHELKQRRFCQLGRCSAERLRSRLGMIEQGVLANRARILGHVVGYFPWHARVTGQMNLEWCGKRPGRIRRGFDHDCVQAVARHGPLQGLDSLVFSPDSSRYAYGGTQNQPGPIFLDGKDTGLT